MVSKHLEEKEVPYTMWAFSSADEKASLAREWFLTVGTAHPGPRVFTIVRSDLQGLRCPVSFFLCFWG